MINASLIFTSDSRGSWFCESKSRQQIGALQGHTQDRNNTHREYESRFHKGTQIMRHAVLHGNKYIRCYISILYIVGNSLKLGTTS